MKVLICMLVLDCANILGADWPHWRGPFRNDTVTETSGWHSGHWIDENPVWQAEVGEGSTSPLVISNRLFVLGWRAEGDHIYCLDTETGKEVWAVSYKCPRYGRYATGDEDAYSGPTATPEFDAQTQYLYTLSCNGDLNCFDTAERGRQVWHVNLYDRFHTGQRPATKLEPDDLRDYGYTTAPCVIGNQVLVEVGSNEGSVVAFEKRTGEVRWVSQYCGPAGHTGGLVPMMVEGVPCVTVLTFDDLLVLRLDRGREGKTAATYPWKSAWGNNVLTPAVQGDSVLIGSWHTHKSLCKLKISLAGARRVWEQPFISFIGSPVIGRNRIYIAGERLFCLNWDTGERLWSGGSYGYGGACILTGDDKLIVWSNLCKATLVANAEESPSEYKQLARLPRVFDGDHAWPHPALANGLLFLKNREGAIKVFRMIPR